MSKQEEILREIDKKEEKPAESSYAKHKIVVTEPLEPNELKKTLKDVAQNILSLEYKQQHILNEWLQVWSKYLSFESKFDSRRLVYYKRGDVVLAHFGYNVGNELGGVHYAVVVERDNNRLSGIVMVVPISSLEAGKTESDLHKSEVFLGQLIDGVEGFAMPLQMRPISKLRIIKPKNKNHGKIIVPGKLLDKIDAKIKLIFTHSQDGKQTKIDS